MKASLFYICPVHVASSHLHPTQRLCGSLAFVWRDSAVLELLKPQTFDRSRFHGEIQEGDRNLSSLSCSGKKSRVRHRRPNTVHFQSRVQCDAQHWLFTELCLRLRLLSIFSLFHHPLQHHHLCKRAASICVLAFSGGQSSQWHLLVGQDQYNVLVYSCKHEDVKQRRKTLFFTASILKQPPSMESTEIKLGPFK